MLLFFSYLTLTLTAFCALITMSIFLITIYFFIKGYGAKPHVDSALSNSSDFYRVNPS